MSEKHIKIIQEARKQLKAYGVSKDESIVDAIDRLTAEHALATDEARVYKAQAEAAQQQADLARETRNGAQNAANVALARERAATFENRALRSFFDLIIERGGLQIQKAYASVLAEVDALGKATVKEAGTTRLEDDIQEVEARRVMAFAKGMEGKLFDPYGHEVGVACLSPNPIHPGAGCWEEKGHRGPHKNGTDIWSGPMPEAREGGA